MAVAVYAGSFPAGCTDCEIFVSSSPSYDPFTYGHLDILRQGLEMFECIHNRHNVFHLLSLHSRCRGCLIL